MSFFKRILPMICILLLLSSCMIMKDLIPSDSNDTVSVSIEPLPVFSEIDIEYEEEHEIYAIEKTALYFRNFDVEIIDNTLTTENLEKAADIEPGEILEALGEDNSGAFTIVRSQHGIIGYMQSSLALDYDHETMYRQAYNPPAGVNRAELIDLSSVLKHAVFEPVLYEKDNYISEKAQISKPFTLIEKNTALKLLAAEEAFYELGYTMKILDAYHPQSAQYALYNLINDETLVENPKDVSHNATGLAVSLTLLGSNGEELQFPTEIFTFTSASARPFSGASSTQRDNAQTLLDVMRGCGMESVDGNWWLFYNPDENFMITNISFDGIILTAARW